MNVSEKVSEGIRQIWGKISDSLDLASTSHLNRKHRTLKNSTTLIYTDVLPTPRTINDLW
jgi:hypothetical protein